jgi:hypothetical protein
MTDRGFSEAMAVLEGGMRITLTPAQATVWRLIIERRRVTDEEAREVALRVCERQTDWMSVAVIVEAVDQLREERRLQGPLLLNLPEPRDPAVARAYLDQIRQMLDRLGRKMQMPGGPDGKVPTAVPRRRKQA